MDYIKDKSFSEKNHDISSIYLTRNLPYFAGLMKVTVLLFAFYPFLPTKSVCTTCWVLAFAALNLHFSLSHLTRVSVSFMDIDAKYEDFVAEKRVDRTVSMCFVPLECVIADMQQRVRPAESGDN